MYTYICVCTYINLHTIPQVAHIYVYIYICVCVYTYYIQSLRPTPEPEPIKEAHREEEC